MNQEELLILVDENDNATGHLNKMEVHLSGLLHRAFSVFIFNSKGQLLLQQRAEHKYHSGGLWTNTCCSHPNAGETLDNAVKRRLKQEMGIEFSDSKFIFNFRYKVDFIGGLTENEIDHVYFGVTDKLPFPNQQEVKNWKYVDMYDLQLQLLLNPERYTEWLKICFDKVLFHFEKLIAQKN